MRTLSISRWYVGNCVVVELFAMRSLHTGNSKHVPLNTGRYQVQSWWAVLDGGCALQNASWPAVCGHLAVGVASRLLAHIIPDAEPVNSCTPTRFHKSRSELHSSGWFCLNLCNQKAIRHIFRTFPGLKYMTSKRTVERCTPSYVSSGHPSCTEADAL